MSEPLIIDGKTVAASVHAKSIEQIAEIKEKYGTVPGLAVHLRSMSAQRSKNALNSVSTPKRSFSRKTPLRKNCWLSSTS